jgi:hypothetical protein
MKRVAALVMVLAACGGGTAATPTTADPRRAAAEEFAVSAGRALEGTRFAGMTPQVLAALLEDLCAGSGLVVAAIDAAVAGAAPPGSAEDDAILAEVLTAGVVAVCPERAAADLTAAFVASVRVTVTGGAGAPVDDGAALSAGLSACASLDAGSPGDALVTIAAALFGVEATEAELLAGAIDPSQGVTAGAVLASAVTYLCPEHADRVGAFIGQLGSDA